MSGQRSHTIPISKDLQFIVFVSYNPCIRMVKRKCQQDMFKFTTVRLYLYNLNSISIQTDLTDIRSE